MTTPESKAPVVAIGDVHGCAGLLKEALWAGVSRGLIEERNKLETVWSILSLRIRAAEKEATCALRPKSEEHIALPPE